jgi:IstB-like ATP binding protein
MMNSRERRPSYPPQSHHHRARAVRSTAVSEDAFSSAGMMRIMDDNFKHRTQIPRPDAWLGRRRQKLARLRLGTQGLQRGLLSLYHRVPRLFTALALARGDGRYAKLLRTLGRVKLLILDDWGPEKLSPDQARDLLEIVEDRYDAGSLVITSQAPVDRWHEIVGNPYFGLVRLCRLGHDVPWVKA